MTEIVIYKAPSVMISGETAEAWEDLAFRVRGLKHVVRREDAYMKPGRFGVVYGEVVWLYLGIKVLDVVTDHALEAMLDRILDTVKTWGRERFRKRSNVPRPRPMYVQIADDDGKIIRSWKIDQDGEEETAPKGEDMVGFGAVVNVHEFESSPWDEANV